jgi:tRNA U55 pseudouridine synthase TruB
LRIGPFTPEMAVPLEREHNQSFPQLLPLVMAVSELPRLEVNDAQAKRLSQGQAIQVNSQAVSGLLGDQEIALFQGKELKAIGRWVAGEKTLVPEKVLQVGLLALKSNQVGPVQKTGPTPDTRSGPNQDVE